MEVNMTNEEAEQCLDDEINAAFRALVDRNQMFREYIQSSPRLRGQDPEFVLEVMSSLVSLETAESFFEHGFPNYARHIIRRQRRRLSKALGLPVPPDVHPFNDLDSNGKVKKKNDRR
jgi:hypothetical protein